MRPSLRFFAIAGLTLAMGLGGAPDRSHARTCVDKPDSLGVARVVDIDVSGGPMFGSITKRKSEKSFLGPKEVVLTFDDGPSPAITNSILRTLDDYCTKATFFSVGRMAISYPQTLKRILKKGHTLGGHTWSHPNNLRHIPFKRAIAQIEKGFSAISIAAGQPIAPFFRFTGLNDSPKLLDYLQKRGIGSFTVDVVSDDSFIHSPSKLTRITLERVERNKGGILLFHDIKRATARALPKILAGLKARGYKVVHLTSKYAFKRLNTYDAKLEPVLAKVLKRQAALKRASAKGAFVERGAQPQMAVFYGTLGPGKYAKMRYLGPPVTEIAPAPRQRLKPAAKKRRRDKSAGAKQRKRNHNRKEARSSPRKSQAFGPRKVEAMALGGSLRPQLRGTTNGRSNITRVTVR